MIDLPALPVLIGLLEAKRDLYDSRLDADIARAMGWIQGAAGEWYAVGDFRGDGVLRRTSYAVNVPMFTYSLDAALTLLPVGPGPFGCNATARSGPAGRPSPPVWRTRSAKRSRSVPFRRFSPRPTPCRWRSVRPCSGHMRP
jgi:hypothetical protein